ncbi:RHS repeat-associated core domain-containing protein [Streptomyces sp. NPDC057638]|uniref:RHS repeat-associated core domain-containing protein n=1 Tax=Streptomyces sp. NPDC057638 TaxID=3346190 RepID=UPI0036D019C0
MTTRTTPARPRRGRAAVVGVTLALSTILTATTVQATPTVNTLRPFSVNAPNAEDPAKTSTIPPARPLADTTRKAAVTTLDPPRWPRPGRASAQPTPSGTTIRPGGLPITLTTPTSPGTAATTAPVPTVGIEVLDRARARALGASTLLNLTPATTPSTARTTVRLTLDYRAFTQAYGGDYGPRLTLYQLPACARTATPGSARCPQPPIPLRAHNNSETRTLTTDLPLAATASLLAIAPTAASSQGTYAATSLAPSASWNVSPSSGGFSWSYPIRTVPTPGGHQPKIGLSYSSQSADGKTAITNNQGSWAGESFAYEPGYVERQYKACADDGHKTSAELCWAHDNATVMLNGSSGQMIRDDTTRQWRMTGDSGWKIEKLDGAVNGDNDGEHWKITADGTEYHFGVNRRHGWRADDPATPGKTDPDPETNSVWTVPVTGDDTAEPCNKPAFADSWCQQAWRWNLDYVKDRHGNTISYLYSEELNAYARGGKTDVTGTPYTAGGYLRRAEYGQRHGSVFTEAAPARVLFTTAERCETTADFDCAPAKWTEANAARWPDTPYDRYCATTAKCKLTQATPSFFTRKKLTAITTQERTGPTSTDGVTPYASVDTWHLKHLFTDNGDSSKTLWLSEIQHEGRGNGGSIKLPSVQLTGRKLDNRVDEIGNNLSPIKRFRLHTVLSESGAQLDITYKNADCAVGSLPAPGASTKRCYPVVWAPPGAVEPLTDWFHKYVVASVQQSDRTGKSDPMVTHYTYGKELGASEKGAAWRKTKPDGITDPTFLTWGQWQGYEKVSVTNGDGQNQTSRVDYTYLQGTHGDALPGGGTRDVTVSDSAGGSHQDLEEYTGFELEKAVYQGTTVQSKVISAPWRHVTGTQTRTWDGKDVILTASAVRTQTTRTFTALRPETDTSPRWRESRTENTLDTTPGAAGRITRVNNLGEPSTPADDQCVRTDYADNPALNLFSLTERVETVSVHCGATPNRATQVISDQRTHYDGAAFGATPTRGLATRTDVLTTHDGTTPTYDTTGTTTYDSYARPLTQTDPAGATTTLTYTEAHGLISKSTSKNHLGHLTTTEYEPAWGQSTAQIDPNNRRTDLAFDALGRLTAVWLPDRAKGTADPSIKYGYLIRQNEVSAVKTEKIGNAGTYNPPEYQLFDALLRPRQHQTEGPNGTRMMADTWYNGLGKVAKTNTTYNALGAPSDKLQATPDGEVGAQTLNLYDSMARPTAEIFAIAGHEQWRTTTLYDSTTEGNRVHTDPPQGAVPTTAIHNEKGQLVELRHFDGAAPVVSGPLGEHTRTTYTYRPGGQLATVTDTENNVWTYAYDQRGRKVKSVDPDAGTSTITYDNADRPVTATDGRKKSVTTTYDVLGRPLTTHDGTSATGRKLTERKYDRAGALGHPYASYRYVDTTHYFASIITGFDTSYRPTGTNVSVPATEGALKGLYGFATRYNKDGTLASTTVPGVGGLPQETLATTYDSLQRPLSLSSAAASYVTNTAWTPTSKLSTLTLSTGANQSQQHFFYEKGTDRVTRQVVTADGLTRAAKDTHTSYDQSGNILSIADTAATTSTTIDVQCYTYDGQRRLTEAWTPRATATTATGSGTVGMTTPEYNGTTPTACTTAKPGINPLGGPAPYWTSYTFDKIGNRVTEVRHDPGRVAAKDTTRTYTAGDANGNGTKNEPGDGGPHAINKVTESKPTGVQQSLYTYDAAGNTRTRTLSGDDQTLTWNSEGKVASITEPDDPTTPDKDESSTSTFLYDADGNRIKRTDPTGTTLYLPGGTELHLPATAGAQPQGTRYYTHAGQTVAVRTEATKVSFISSDRHGTGDLTIDATTTSAVTQRRLDPYGNPRTGTTGTWPGQKGFVGGTIDTATGLTNIGARQYDAALGRFISVDPLIDIQDAQQMNGYAYANNNPTSFSDPTGLILGCGGSAPDCPTNKSNPPGQSSPGKNVSQAESNVGVAEYTHKKARQSVVTAVRKLVKILKDELGVNAAMDCISSGDVSSCGETFLNIAGSFAGGLAGKALIKYGPPTQWANVGKLAKRVNGLLDDIVSGVKETWDASQRLNRARDKYAAALARYKKAQKTGDRCHSFLPGTLVLLADGTRKPIEDVRPGERVVTTDPKTGKETTRTVVGTIVTEDDKHFVDLTIRADGRSSSLISTTTQPFWIASKRQWVEAGDLKPGSLLTTPQGATALVEETQSFEKRQRTYDLTIAHLHAYYVLTGSTPVLVHNVNESDLCNLTLGPNLRGQRAEGVNAERGDTVLAHEQRMVNEFGDRNGCAACGADESGYRDGHWTGDHNPPNRLSPNGPWTLYPHCKACSKQQGGIVRTLIKEYYDFPAWKPRQ